MMMAVQWAVWGLLTLATPIYALRTVAGSPCTAACGVTTNTTSDEIACIDSFYNTTDTGKNFQKCVSCLLSSPYQNTTIGETDVDWGLYNLRYAFSSCVYDFPVSVTNVSTPCLVSCTPLGPALNLQLTEPVGNSLENFCSSTSFADNIVTTCNNCYALTSQQAYLANFLESIRYNCHFPTPGGIAFSIASSRIFNTTQLPTTTGFSTPTSTSSGTSTVHKFLTVIIVMPIIGFLIIIALLTLCCFCLVRNRRKAAKRRRNNMHNRWAPNAFNAQWQPAWAGYPISAYHQTSPMLQQQHYMAGGMTPYGALVPGSGFQVVDHDGKRYEAGYSTHYISPVSPEVTNAQQPFQFGTDVTHTQDIKQPIVKQAEAYPAPQQEQPQQKIQEYYPPPDGPHAT
ncbi:conserved hypothetical protein [Talaromyces stipitatus ATCC 10500]|uniref:Uncharacterized protein n=1 Tax=Talaromyces stipitatus (strain ATCC 10500 / CBS 375.48 / QM 6759 / NRRL 1006) TaxID=441959 RepID=B8MHU2_TALSN|nr:uncharacterized protein TSTA_015120 [Talaromyces stipitatus ATCC 10500]XP_002483657.1 uncharacterized protein TSTA_015120 [Talaromyces stipitatus ATCC 10500]XP_002483658.1 uncharacterized protein TSTA_015120 [Talaromyces stipitatus ATCC 10500]EED16422.1 conserved hypothetical protein [Talaromyces stipitatus ATCC 10500]EED16423.1 conserved hypothetical protein [Talaromyces stipitatus ATCC 10500]EED16424.1 conserved hypothetical protein [Talaromyces stipitatus ATCC 10500]